MRLRNALFVFIVFLTTVSYSQFTVSGTIKNNKGKTLNQVEVYNENGGLLDESTSTGEFRFKTNKQQLTVIFYSENYRLKTVVLSSNEYKMLACN